MKEVTNNPKRFKVKEIIKMIEVGIEEARLIIMTKDGQKDYCDILDKDVILNILGEL